MAVKRFHEVFVTELARLGFIEGRNLQIDFKSASGDYGRLPLLAEEMIAAKPNALVGIEAVGVVLRSKTDRIPIILTSGNDPVRAGLVQSLARPGTNVTGLAALGDSLIAKHVDLLYEVRPGIERIGLLNDVSSPASARFEQVAREATGSKGIALTVAGVVNAKEIPGAFTVFRKSRVEAIVVVTTGFFNQLARDILKHVSSMGVPSASGLPVETWGEHGGLLTYGFNFIQGHRRAAQYVDRILRGARPADLPIEQISQFDFTLNLRTARLIGLRIPQPTLLRADRVIE